MKRMISKIWSRLCGLNGVLLIVYVSLVYILQFATNENWKGRSVKEGALLAVILVLIVCPTILRILKKITISWDLSACINDRKYERVLQAAFYLIPAIVLLVYYYVFYPGGFSTDSFSQYEQTITNQYNDWHPVVQTLFAIKLPLLLSGGWNGSIVLFQIICMSAVLGYGFHTLYTYTNVKYTLVTMGFILLNPLTGALAMFPWKDVSFGMGALLLLIYTLRIYLSKGEWIKKPINVIVFVLAAVLTSLFRHNAVLFTAPMVLAAALAMPRKKAGVVILSVLILVAGVKGPGYAALHVESPDRRQVETLGLPMTVIAAVVQEDPNALSEETLEFAYKLAPREVWESYICGSFNSVKWNDDMDLEVIEEYGAVRILSMMLECFAKSPKIALTALVDLTKSAYLITEDSCFEIIIPGANQNTVGIIPQVKLLPAEIWTTYFYFFKQTVLCYGFLSLGLVHVVLLASVLAKCDLRKFADWKRILCIVPVFCYNFGSSLLLTGVEDATRFFAYTLWLLPILLVFLYRKENEEGAEVSAQEGL